MALVDVVMPQMGESIAEGTITKWYKKIGEKIGRDETLLEISTDKVDSEIPSPAAGTVAEILFPEQETVNVHTVIARIKTDGAGAFPTEQKAEPAPPVVHEKVAPPVVTAPEIQVQPSSQKVSQAIENNDVATDRFYSPLVMNIARTEGVSMSELETIAGTGTNGRITKNDILQYVRNKKPQQHVHREPQQPPIQKGTVSSSGTEIIKMDAMRKAIAEHMVRSVHTSAHVGSVTEADVSKIVAFREKQKTGFEKREGFKLTYTPFFVEAVVKAIKDYPMLNSSVEDDSIIIRKDINIGVAVALESGLIVPVVKHADNKNLAGLARAVNDLSNRARLKKLAPDEVQSGTFTITNPGIFGNLYGFPIINQPQVGILGIGVIKKRPVVIEDGIAIRSMVYISMSYDHRVVDGALGGMFLERIVQYLENFDGEQGI
jgi:2-oxoglutarate dehydrogenase E2 component (dihydrolipoamide succinyltransferase)